MRRQSAVADAQNNKIVLRELIADDFAGNEIDEGEPNPYDRSAFFDKEMPDSYFFSYAASDEKLLERTRDTAVVSCLETICRHPPKGALFPTGEDINYWRTKITFVCRSGRWQIAALDQTVILADGSEYS